jgi:hypothetical protein
MKELKASEKIKNKFKGKVYAGVCADSAIITTAMLRRVGIMAGIGIGYVPKNKKVTSKEAHAVSFIVLPSQKGRNEVCLVDSTPSSLDEKMNERIEELRSVSFEKADEERKKVKKSLMKSFGKKVFKFKELFKLGKKSEIKKITELELNVIIQSLLEKQKDFKNIKLIEEVLQNYWYNPGFSESDVKEIADNINKYNSKISLLEEDIQIKDLKAEDLYKVIKDYIRRFEKAKKEGKRNIENVYELMEKILKMIKPYINKSEQQAIEFILMYLRSK